jgi:hypothetical protein
MVDTNQWDSTFDLALGDIVGINRLPWVGLNYSETFTKTLILGESVYNWKPDEPDFIEEISSSQHLRTLHVNHAMNPKRASGYVRNIERALSEKKNLSDDEKRGFWNKVIYHNLVARVMKNKKARPNYNDYLHGWALFERVLGVLSPDQVIVYGLEGKKIEALREHFGENVSIERAGKIGSNKPAIANILTSEKEIKLVFIRHPSAFFSWRKWGSFINTELLSTW